MCARVCVGSELWQVVVPQALQDLDQALQSKHVAPVRSVMHCRVATETFKGGVSKVDHTYIHQGGLLGLGGRRRGKAK